MDQESKDLIVELTKELRTLTAAIIWTQTGKGNPEEVGEEHAKAIHHSLYRRMNQRD